MKRKLSTITAALLMALLMVIVSGCTPAGTSVAPAEAGAPEAEATAPAEAEAAAAEGNVFRFVLSSDIVSFDPLYSYDFITNPVVSQIAEGLLYFDKDCQLQCLLAESWECADPTTYVYNVRNNVAFSDGTPLTMDDVLYSFERYRDADLASYLAWMYDAVASIEQTGDWQITVRLKQPDAMWKYTFATCGGAIIQKAFCEAHPDDFGTPGVGIVATGAYKFDSWTSGSEIVMSKNENYWNKDQVIDFDKIVFSIIPEDTTRVAAITAGQVDLSLDAPVDMLQEIKACDQIKLSMINSFGIDFVCFNTQRAPFDDVNVRKAIAHAIDKQALYDSVLAESGQPATTIPFSNALYTVAPDMWKDYAPTVPDYEYDMAKAKECLAASAYPDGFDCVMTINETSVKNSVALMLQQSCKELGINITIKTVTNEELTSIALGSQMVNGVRDYDLAFFEWMADFPDPAGNLLPVYWSKNIISGGCNEAGYLNPEVDALLEAQAASTSDTERAQLMQQAIDIISNDVPMAFIDYPMTRYVTSNRLAPYELSAAWLWNVYVKDIHLA